MEAWAQLLVQAEAAAGSGDLASAARLATQAVQKRPAEPAVHATMSLIHVLAGRPKDAVTSARRACALSPKDGMLRVALAQRLAAAGDQVGCLAELDCAKALRPDDPVVWSNDMSASMMARRPSRALASGMRALALRPEDPETLGETAMALAAVGRPREAAAMLRDGVARFPGNPKLRIGLASMVHYDTGCSPAERAAVHRSAAEALGPGVPRAGRADRREGPITVAVVSSDLRRHSVAFFIEPFLRHRDRTRVRVVGVPCSPFADDMTTRLKGLCDAWEPMPREDSATLASACDRHGVDVILELNGWSLGHRVAQVAGVPRPRVTYCGYAHAMYLPWLDGRIVDRWTDPPEAEDPEVTRGREPLLRLDRCFLSYSPPTDAPAVAPRGEGPVTFGSFNALTKVGEATVELWSAVLREVPGSRLVLKALTLEEEEVRASLRARFEAAGVAADRLDLIPPRAGMAEHLAAYADVDIGLDPFPYHGTTTTCEALWMGVPVVSLAGDGHASRVGASLLRAAGLPDLVARDQGAFVAIARGLAMDPARRAELRATLRDRVSRSELCDGPGLARAIEAGLRRVVSG